MVTLDGVARFIGRSAAKLSFLKEHESPNSQSPEPFYLLPDNGNGLSSLVSPVSDKEANLYSSRTGKTISAPKIVFAGSGGSSKGNYIVGVLKAADELGITIDKYAVTSVSSFAAIYHLTKDYKIFEQLALEVPELLYPPSNSTHLNTIRKFLPASYYESMRAMWFFVKSLRTQEVETLNGSMKLNRGFFDTSALENRLREICGDVKIGDLNNFYIVSTEWPSGKVAILGRDYPEMPLYTAILAGISIPQLFPFVQYRQKLFVDGGLRYHLPLLPEVLNENDTTIIAVLLGYPFKHEKDSNYSGVRGIFSMHDSLNSIHTKETTDSLVMELTGSNIDEIIKSGDLNCMRLYVLPPDLANIPFWKVSIPMDERIKLIEMGYNDARKGFSRNFRIIEQKYLKEKDVA